MAPSGPLVTELDISFFNTAARLLRGSEGHTGASAFSPLSPCFPTATKQKDLPCCVFLPRCPILPQTKN
ncbi:rCG43165 [Rattus norvegicus]|uniref:RCG43165 n=1 Tax=Rattus norvegicus TaxID=10116 RepID=A6IW19_RAT|nr:rCG43165 [Rattus norvegicus]